MDQRAEESARAFGKVLAVFSAAFLTVLVVVGLLAKVGLSDRASTMMMVALAIVAFGVIAFLGRTMRRTEFQYGGKDAPAVHNAMSMAAAFVGGTGFIGLAGAFFGAGSGALAFVLGTVGGFVLLTVLIAPYFRSSGAATVTDLLTARFGSRLMRLLAPLLVLVCSFGLLVTEITIGGGVVSSVFGWNADKAVAVVSGLILVTTLFGGLRALTLTAVAQYLVMIVAFLAPLVVYSTTEFSMPLPQVVLGNALHRLAAFPGDAAAQLSMAAMHRQLLPAEGFNGLNFLLIVVTLAAGIASLPHLIMRVAPAVNVDGARRASALAFILAAVIVVSAPAYSTFAGLEFLHRVVGETPNDAPDWVYALGRAGHARICGASAVSADAVAAACNNIGRASTLAATDISIAGDSIVPAFPMIAELPPILGALLAAGVLAATLAAAGATLFAVASAIAHDFYVRLLDAHAPAGRRLIALRLVLVAVAFYAGWSAIHAADRWLPWSAASVSVAAAGLFPALVLGIWWRRCTSLGALTGMLCGAAVTLFYFVLVEYDGETPWRFFGVAGTAVPGFAAGALGLPVGLLVAILVSLATPPEPIRYAAIDSIRRPNAAPLIEEDD